MNLYEYENRHNALIRELGAECAVLLKSNGDFPLDSAGKLALYGNGARATVKGGSGSGEVNSRFFVTAEQGLKEAGFTITTEEWLEGYEAFFARTRKKFLADIRAEAKKRHKNPILYGMGKTMSEFDYALPLTGEGDVCVYVLARRSGEGADRKPGKGDVRLTDAEVRDIMKAREKYKKFMLVLNVGGPVDLAPVLAVENILLLGQLGTETGHILADILLGKSAPCGKLTTTWAAYGDYPDVGSFGEENETRYREGIYVGYRYFTTVGKKALFPFGHGLTYTDFSVKTEQILLDGMRVTVRVRVTNTGKRAGKEAVQLYVSIPEGKLDQPFISLVSFAKTKELSPGEGVDLYLSFSMADIASYDAERESWILEAGSYILRPGLSSEDTEAVGEIFISREIIVSKAKNVLGRPDFEDCRFEKAPRPLPGSLPVLKLDPEAVVSREFRYDTPEEIEPAAEALSDEELALFGLGAFASGGVSSLIGNSSLSVAGAAGETSSLGRRKIPTLVMADGPAGLRLAGEYYRDAKGTHAVGSTLPESVRELMPRPLALLLDRLSPKPGRGVKIREQYASAIPIGTAIAQSMNTTLAEALGDLVGEEMERFGVQLWLAPALNIHRSILCGRNFEYFSEDPLISGYFAAAITRGVQSHPGCGTTLKHYAANNQEKNRYYNNSQVSERAMREIYLKGFGIAVRLARPQAVMTSYNLLNGVHTSEHRGLIADILRAEFGFQGIVMTDWVVSGMEDGVNPPYPAPKPHRAAASGSDLFMPGSKADYEELLGALRSGEVERRQLLINASRLMKLIRLDKKRRRRGGE
ncbi:MAG: glycoside hydrolase family 3 C-terminal domain-containing protein [Lachnospiraceae bacterium]|nr:glycoside hydrolase family 3 C-terminal domain-containing protein [Lachnospiraceae bacterium]